MQSFDAGLFAGACRQQNHRHGLHLLIRADGREQSKPIERRHHDVAQDQIGRLGLDAGERLATIAHRLDPVALAEDAREVLTHVGVVVDNQNPSRIGRHRSGYDAAVATSTSLPISRQASLAGSQRSASST